VPWNAGKILDSKYRSALHYAVADLSSSPRHLLADFVERILENRLDRSAHPHDATPVPVADRNKPLVPLCTLPFIADFEVSAAIWEPLLFPITSAKLPALSEIMRYSVKIPIKIMPACKWRFLNK
jgi:hypothetical protein